MVGGGGREHAIAWKLKRDDPSIELHCAPGNPGIAELAICHAIPATDLDGLVRLAIWERFDFTIVGPEAPLAGGLADRLTSRGFATFGPSGAAAHIESSKRFAKEIMARAHVPTARATSHTSVDAAKTAVRTTGTPIVIKASGLASGKGVIVCESVAAADQAIDDMLTAHRFGSSGDEVLVEEFMEGEELSLFFLTDGENSRAMVAAQDHKRLLDGDEGPNTGGMGAYAPVSLATPELVAQVQSTIVQPTLGAMRDVGVPFRGLLYCGLMLTTDGPKVVEFNCRFGDPETQVVLPLMISPLLPFLKACTVDDGLAEMPALDFSDDSAVTTVIAADGYPDSPRGGDAIDLSRVPDDVVVFHAGTSRAENDTLRTSGGRVFAVTGVAPTFAEAQRRSRQGAEQVHFWNRQFRRDIGFREQSRRAGVA